MKRPLALLVPVLVFLIAAPASGQGFGTQHRLSQMGPAGNTNHRGVAPEAAYNSQANQFLVVWQGDHSTDNEFEVWGRLLDGAGNPVGTQFQISRMGPDGDAGYFAERPQVAYNSQANEYLVTWKGEDDAAPVDGEGEIFAQRLTATGAEIGVDDFRISQMGIDGQRFLFYAQEPDIAYNAQTNEYLVTWAGVDVTADELEVFGQRLNAAGAQVGDDDFRISKIGSDNANNWDADPSVAYNSQANEYLLAWYSDDSGDDDGAGGDIFGQRLTAAGAETGADDFRISRIGTDGDIRWEALEPDVAYNPQANEYLIAWWGYDNRPPIADGEAEVFGQRLTAAGAETGADDFRISALGPDGNVDYFASRPHIDYSSQVNEYLVVFYGDDNTAPLVDEENEVFGQRLTASGAETGADDFRISQMGPDGDGSRNGPDGNPSFGGFFPTAVYNPQTNEHLVAWNGVHDPSPWDLEIFARTVGPDADGDGFRDSADACASQSDLAAPRNPRNGCPADPVVNQPPPPPPPPGPDPEPPPDATAGAPTACFAVTPAIRKRTKLVPGGGEVLLTVSQTADPAVPLKIATGTRRGVKAKSVAFKVNTKTLASTSTSLLVPFSSLKIGARNAISVVVTLTNKKKVTVNDFVGLVKCPVPPVSCERLAGGAQLRCSSSMPLRARSVSVTVFGADGRKATGKARVTAKKGAKKGTYTLTMKTPVTFLPGRFVYKHVATTTRKGEKLLAVRVLNLK